MQWVAVIKGCLVTGGGVRISGEIMNLRYSYGVCENGRSRGCERGKNEIFSHPRKNNVSHPCEHIFFPMLSFQRLERLHGNQDPCGSVCGFLISGVLSLSSKLSLYALEPIVPIARVLWFFLTLIRVQHLHYHHGCRCRLTNHWNSR